MRKRILILAVVSGIFSLLTGCQSFDGRPIVGTYNPPPEYKLKSITHWNIIANDVANQIQAAFEASSTRTASDQEKINQANKPTKIPALYIANPDITGFDKVFSSQLKSILIEKGFEIRSTPKNALTINFKVNAIHHIQVRKNTDYVPGTLTALTGGLLVIRDTALYNPSAAVPTTLGIAGGIDLYALWVEMNKRPNTEIALTTSAEVGDRYIIHQTDSYYIDTVDTGLFTGSKSKEFEITSGVKK